MKDSYTIYIVSGGAGTSGEQLVHTVLAQFPDSQVEVIKVTNVRFESQIAETIANAADERAAIVHTLVDAGLRARLVALAEEKGVATFDLMGPLIKHLEEALDEAALSQPGLYRKLNKAYFDRVAAIEYTLAHDDGQRADTWQEAEIVILGVSRSGKTPISLYLSVLGWKVANLPLVIGMQPPSELFRLDRKKVIGLKLDAGQLMLFRQQRQRRLGVAASSPYTDPEKIIEELEFASEIYQRNRFITVDVTDKPIESAADEIIRIITGQR